MDRQNVAYDLSMYEALLEPKAEKQVEKQQAKTVKVKTKYAFRNFVNIVFYENKILYVSLGLIKSFF